MASLFFLCQILLTFVCFNAKDMKIPKDSAIVVVDMLYDFIDGSMACAHAGPAVTKALELLQQNAEATADGDVQEIIQAGGSVPVLFVCDSHPADHCSFTEQGGPWPPHCVSGTRGAEIHDALKPFADEACIFRKGCDKALEQYSGFEGRNAAGQSLAEVLEILDAQSVLVVGIATEYCVRNTAEDLLKAGFPVTVLEDALAYVDYQGHLEALDAMKKENIQIR